jgi:putative hydrolase of the HAD superfamily
VYFNPEGKTIDLKPTYEIRHLQELELLLWGKAVPHS